jgi:hypothetical protein
LTESDMAKLELYRKSFNRRGRWEHRGVQNSP